MKIDKRKEYILLIDTETCPIEPTNEVNPNNMLVYDIGYRIIDKQGNCYLERSFIVKEIFMGEYEKMASAYYGYKCPLYHKDIAEDYGILKTYNEIAKIIKQDIKDFGIDTIAAHNARFDCLSLSNTTKYLESDYLLPYGITWWDTLKMARSTIAKRPTYKRFCEENGFMTKHKTPRVQLKAETLYRYFTNDTDFEEEHRALSDARIETEILARCFATHKKMDKELWER